MLEVHGIQGEGSDEGRRDEECKVKGVTESHYPSAAGFQLLLPLQRKQRYAQGKTN